MFDNAEADLNYKFVILIVKIDLSLREQLDQVP